MPATAMGGTHPTGMHSCLNRTFSSSGLLDARLFFTARVAKAMFLHASVILSTMGGGVNI